MTVEIQRAELLTDLFGHWPDFHDADLLSLQLTASKEAILEAEFEVAEMSDEVDGGGYFRDRQRARTRLRFTRVARARLLDFYDQNVLSELSIGPAGDVYAEAIGPNTPQSRRRYRVRWQSAVGCEGDFLCDGIEVLEASPVVRAT